jgi:hypothetical protein
VDYVENDAFPAETHEGALDRLTYIEQQQQEELGRALKVSTTDETSSMELPVKATRATKMLGFDADGDPIMSASTVDEIDASVTATFATGILASAYQFTGDGTTVDFTLGGGITDIPNSQSIIVDIDGVTQHTDTYTVSGKVVTFSVAPPLNGDIQVRYNAYLGDALVSDFTETIATMKALSPAVNSSVNVLGYYVAGDGGGGTFYWDASSTATDNGGTIIKAAPTTGRWIRAYDDDGINVKWFGAGLGVLADDAVAIQAAVTASEYFSGNAFDGYSGIYAGYRQKVILPAAKYIIDSTITGGPYCNLEGARAIFVAGTSIGTAWAVTGNFWMGRISGIQFINFTNALYINTGNIDTGKTIISECDFLNNTVALNYNSTSSIGVVEHSKFHNNVKSIINTSCDHFIFKDSWLSDGISANDYDAQIDNYGSMQVLNLLHVPIAQTALKTAVINNYFKVECDKCRFGGEPGSRTIINNFAEGGATGINQRKVSIINCSLYTSTGDPIVLYKLPNSVVIKDNMGLTDDVAILSFDTNLTTVAAEITRLGTALSIDVDFNYGKGIEAVFYRQIAQYILINNETVSYGYSDGIATNLIYDPIKFYGGRNSVDYYFFRRNTLYQIDVSIPSEVGGAFSSYYVKANYAGDNILDLIPIYEGVSASAPRLINDGNILKVKTNGTTAVISYTYRVSRIDSAFHAV